MTVEAFLVRYGAVAIFAGSMLEGDVTPVLAGVAAQTGGVSLPVAVTASALGILAGDCVWFVLGRHLKTRLHATRAWARAGGTVERLAARFGPLEIALARLVYGVRNVSMLFWGAQGLPLARFLAVDAPVAAAWAALLAGLGHTASGGAEAVLGEVERLERWLLAAVAICVAVVALWWRLVAPRR